jgi:hypothetical protein
MIKTLKVISENRAVLQSVGHLFLILRRLMSQLGGGQFKHKTTTSVTTCRHFH